MTSAERAFDRTAQALQVAGQVVLVFMMVTICTDALMRYGFAAPTSWSLEVNGFLIVYLAAMTAADVQRTDGHIRITFFADRLPLWGQRLTRVAVALAGAAFSAIMAWRGGLLALQALSYGERVSSGFGTPLVLPYALLPLGFGMLALRFLLDALRAGSAGQPPPA